MLTIKPSTYCIYRNQNEVQIAACIMAGGYNMLFVPPETKNVKMVSVLHEKNLHLFDNVFPVHPETYNLYERFIEENTYTYLIAAVSNRYVSPYYTYSRVDEQERDVYFFQHALHRLIIDTLDENENVNEFRLFGEVADKANEILIRMNLPGVIEDVAEALEVIFSVNNTFEDLRTWEIPVTFRIEDEHSEKKSQDDDDFFKIFGRELGDLFDD